MIEVSFKTPRSGRLIYGVYPDLKSTPKEIFNGTRVYFLYGVYREVK